MSAYLSDGADEGGECWKEDNVVEVVEVVVAAVVAAEVVRVVAVQWDAR